jgi:hypothetical protein
MLDGRWTTFEARVAAQQPAAVRLDTLDDWPAAPDIEDAAASFRYARNLVSADETERWLDSTGMTSAEWWRWLAIQLRQETAPNAVPHRSGRADLTVDGVCSGWLRDAAECLSGKAAVASIAARSAYGDADMTERGLADGRIEAALRLARGSFPELDLTDLRDRLVHLTRIGHTFVRLRDAACTSSRIASQVEAHAAAWQRVDLLRLSCASEDLAREVLRALRDDGLPAATVTAMARIPSACCSMLVDEADPAWRDWAGRAPNGDTFGPVAAPDQRSGTDVMVLVDRRPPTPADLHIAARAVAAIEREVVEDASRGVVTWPNQW